jgi:hypothetical protein
MVELYPGLMCEGQGRCLDPGTSGPNGTGTALWSGVFCDAVTLVRSDRFYTLVSSFLLCVLALVKLKLTIVGLECGIVDGLGNA